MLELLTTHFRSAGMSEADCRRYAHSLNLMLPSGGSNGQLGHLLGTLSNGLRTASREIQLSAGKSLDPNNFTPLVIEWME